MGFADSILVPTDLSAASYAALSEAARLSLREGSRVTLLHVFDVAPFRLLPQDGTLSESTLRRIAEEANGAAHTVLLNLRARFFSGVRDVEVAILQHDGAAAGVCAAAKNVGADLIVITSHGRGGRAGTGLGSVTANIVRSAPCRVLVVPSDDPESHTH